METKSKTRRAKGEGAIDLMADGRFRARVNFGVDLLGKRVRRAVYGRTRAEVAAKLRELLTAKGEGILPDAKTEQMRVDHYLTMWVNDIARPAISPQTYHGYETAIRKHIIPTLGHHDLGQLRPLHIQKLYSDLEKNNVGSRTRQLVHVTLTNALGRAVKLELVAKNPALNVEKPRHQKKEIRALSPREVEHLLSAAAEDRLLHFYVLAVTTGMRPGEMAALKWSDINLVEGTIAVQRRIGYAMKKVTIEKPKTAAGRRRIALSDRAIQSLRDQKEQNARENLGACEWVFPELNGEPLRVYYGLSRFDDLIKNKTSLGKVTLYGLRHTFATLALAAGIPLKVVSEMLGHASIQITADTYQHVLPSIQDEAISKLNAFFSPKAIGSKIGDQDSLLE